MITNSELLLAATPLEYQCLKLGELAGKPLMRMCLKDLKNQWVDVGDPLDCGDFTAKEYRKCWTGVELNDK